MQKFNVTIEGAFTVIEAGRIAEALQGLGVEVGITPAPHFFKGLPENDPVRDLDAEPFGSEGARG